MVWPPVGAQTIGYVYLKPPNGGYSSTIQRVSDYLSRNPNYLLYLCKNKHLMDTRQQCIALLTEATPFIKNEFGVRSLRLFGSMARGDNHAESDIDLCVDMPPKAFKLLSLKTYLQDLLGTAVDLVRMNPNLDKFLISEIERDGICIFS